jgi:hypothetical protein
MGAGAGAGAGETIIPDSRVGISSELRSLPDLFPFSAGETFSHIASIY